MLKQRTPNQIRIDALKMGIKKAQIGCPTCAEKYFELAKLHGAIDQEIQDALEESTGMIKRGLNRRELLKLAVASSMALTTTGILSVKTSHTAMAASYYFGVDSNTTNCCGNPLNFYVGRLGYGETADQSYFAFNVNMATQVGNPNTFGYWGVLGPSANTSYSTYYDWGVAQADAAWTAWENNPYVGGYTVFGDLEDSFGGWDSSNTSNNQDVVNGFLDELFSITPSNPDVWPGIYVRPNFWNTYLGNSFAPSSSFVLWIVGVDDCTVCAPCASCTTTADDAQSHFASNVQPLWVGGQQPVLWQYWLSPGCPTFCGDYDISAQFTESFVPTNAY